MTFSRRRLLTYGSALTLSPALSRLAFSLPEEGAELGEGVSNRFAVPFRTPPVLSPVLSDRTSDYYEIFQKESTTEILPGIKTRIWGYQGMFPGPTIEARRGREVIVRHTNLLPVQTAVHLHGGVTPSASDGFPMDFIRPGESRTYIYPNNHQGATLWYHDHAMGDTGRNIYMGLAGLYLLKDDAEASLGLPRGPYDVPLLIQDRLFGLDGSFIYKTLQNRGAKPGVILVNGVPYPRMEVATRKYRFRILNGSNATPFRLGLSSGQSFVQIATDGGLLSSPVSCRAIPIAMAERVEVVIDFSEYPIGTRIMLQNLTRRQPSANGAIMCFDVVRKEVDDSIVPDRLSEIMPIPRDAAVRTRRFVFSGRLTFGIPPNNNWMINDNGFDPERSIADPGFGDVEIWHLRNDRFLGMLGMLHPIHVHLVNFQILERNGRAPFLWERGWKDTVALNPGEEVKVIMKFVGYRGRYLIHCHNLEHEEHSMMARYDVV
jgi:spore coat protein A, manganese oxidase